MLGRAGVLMLQQGLDGFFFPPDQQRFPKKEIFPVLLRAVLTDRRDKQQGSHPAASSQPLESRAVQALLSNSASNIWTTLSQFSK